MDHSMHNMADKASIATSSHEMKEMACSMQMTLNWSVNKVCVVFDWWRVDNAWSMALSCFIVIFLGIGYELLRAYTSNLSSRLERLNYHQRRASDVESLSLNHQYDPLTSPLTREEDDIHQPPPSSAKIMIGGQAKSILSILYGAQVFYSFLLMLVFMTYNGYLMISIAIGASIGYFIASSYAPLPPTRAASCH